MIENNNGGRYTYTKRLGWCIVGTISNVAGKDSMICHRMKVQDVVSSKIADNQFVFEEFLKLFKHEESNSLKSFSNVSKITKKPLHICFSKS